MSEPFKRVGRGGAGNYVSKDGAAQQSSGGNQDDLEAQRRDSNPNEISGASLERASGAKGGAEAPFVRTGRGGAGNLTNADDDERQQANALEASAAAARRASANNTPVGAGGLGKPSGSGGNAGPSAAPMTRGRGGAGNYAGAAEDEKERQRREDDRDREARERVRREVEAKVDGALKPPGKAVVGHAKANGDE